MDTSAKERALQGTPPPTGRPRTVLSISHHTYRADGKKEHDEPRGVKASNAAHKEILKFAKIVFLEQKKGKQINTHTKWRCSDAGRKIALGTFNIFVGSCLQRSLSGDL